MNNKTMPRACWITWEIQTRNRSISKLLDADLYELISKKNRVLRYITLIIKTINICRNYDVVYAQNPSIVLALLAVTIGAFTKKVVIVDAHNSGIFPLDGRSHILNFVTKIICKSANTIIVTNRVLAEVVVGYGGRPFILPDPIPHLSYQKHAASAEHNDYIFFICTWASDEPYFEVIEAAKKIPSEIKILISGRYNKKIDSDTKNGFPKNVILLGFVEEDEYNFLLANAIASIDLTTRENCLVCGAYESAGFSVPCIVSDNEVNRMVFHSGFVYSKPNSEDISNAILTALRDNQRLRSDIRLFATTHNEVISKQLEKLKKFAENHQGV